MIRNLVILELLGALLAGVLALALVSRPDLLALGVTFVTMLHALVVVVTALVVAWLALAAFRRRLRDDDR